MNTIVFQGVSMSNFTRLKNIQLSLLHVRHLSDVSILDTLTSSPLSADMRHFLLLSTGLFPALRLG